MAADVASALDIAAVRADEASKCACVAGGCGFSLYIFRHMPASVLGLSCRVSNASRTLMTSRGYVKKTEHMPAKEPDAKRRIDVSCNLSGMKTARI